MPDPTRRFIQGWLRDPLGRCLRERGFTPRGRGWSCPVEGNALVVLPEFPPPERWGRVLSVSYGAISTVGSPYEADKPGLPTSDAWTVQRDVRPEPATPVWAIEDPEARRALDERLLPELLARLDEIALTGACDAALLAVLRFGATGGAWSGTTSGHSEFLNLLSAYRIGAHVRDVGAVGWAAAGLRRMWRKTGSPGFRITIEVEAKKLGLSLDDAPLADG